MVGRVEGSGAKLRLKKLSVDFGSTAVNQRIVLQTSSIGSSPLVRREYALEQNKEEIVAWRQHTPITRSPNFEFSNFGFPEFSASLLQ